MSVSCVGQWESCGVFGWICMGSYAWDYKGSVAANVEERHLCELVVYL